MMVSTTTSSSPLMAAMLLLLTVTGSEATNFWSSDCGGGGGSGDAGTATTNQPQLLVVAEPPPPPSPKHRFTRVLDTVDAEIHIFDPRYETYNGNTTTTTMACHRELYSANSNEVFWQGSCDGGGEANFIELSTTTTAAGGVITAAAGNAGDDDDDDATTTSTFQFGSFHRQNEICVILPDANGETILRCVDMDDFVTEGGATDEQDLLDLLRAEDAVAAAAAVQAEHNETNEGGGDYHRERRQLLRDDDDQQQHRRRRNFAMAHSHDSLTHRRLYDDSGSTLDIMVLWTKKAECMNSDLPPDCTPTLQTELNIMGLAYLAVAEANAAFELSNVETRLRLVHTYRTPDYEEPTDALAQRTILRNLARTTDLAMDEVHDLRTLYGADLVHMIVGAAEACGRGYGGPEIRAAFSISNYVCSAGFYTLAHEVGHNFGAEHDRGSLGLCEDDLEGFNYGYSDSSNEFRTIMASNCVVGRCDNITLEGCVRVQRFSSNETLFNGKPLGDDRNNNVKVFNSNRAALAAFHPAMDCIYNDQCDDQVNTTIDICDPIRRVCIFLSETTIEKTVGALATSPNVTVPECFMDSLQTYYRMFWQTMSDIGF